MYSLVYVSTPCCIGCVSGLRNLVKGPDLDTLQEDLITILLENRRMFLVVLAYTTDVVATTGDAIMDCDTAVE